jgi:excinuclease ABC subunit B
MAEDLTDYLRELGLKVRYLHSEINTLERMEIIRDLRLGVFDVLVGINLLREGLDLPEVSLVAILDADKEGFLREKRSLIQTIGRAARNINGKVIMYADTVTESMRRAISETERRRRLQMEYNKKYNITPATVRKAVREVIEATRHVNKELPVYLDREKLKSLGADQFKKVLENLEKDMKEAARNLEFERAAELRDILFELRRSRGERKANGTGKNHNPRRARA